MAAVESFTFTRRIVLRLRIRLGISLAASPLCVDFARFTSERYPRADVRGIASLALLDAVSVTPAVGLARELLGSPSVDFARCGEYGVERHRDTLDLDK
jgi:hypothetical protein